MGDNNKNEFEGIIEGKPRKKEKASLSRPNKSNFERPQNFDAQIDDLLEKFQSSPLIVNRLDYYGNSIPLGAFCFAVSFVLYGFYECKVFSKPDTFIYTILFIFGGIGQLTAGVFEYIKARTFPTVVYILFGLYFISFFLFNKYFYHINDCRKIYFGTWAGLTFPVLIGSFKTNVIYILQIASVLGFFIVRCIGECRSYDVLNTTVSGILELVTGFLSLYLCFSQVLNEHFRCTILPTFAIQKDNEIDINVNTQNIKN
jgi:succinate-acetate transporter protein